MHSIAAVLASQKGNKKGKGFFEKKCEELQHFKTGKLRELKLDTIHGHC